MNPLIIYHSDCWDGFCAAWVLRNKYPDAEFHAAHYGTEPPDVTGKRVIVVDFCYPRATMLKLIAESDGVLTLLDHHKTAQADCDGIESDKCGVTFDMTKSGARLAWEWLYGRHYPSPWIVNYTEDRDLWKWALPDSKEVNAALRSFPLDFDVWDHFGHWKEFVSDGRAILRRESQIIEQHIRHAVRKEIGGVSVPVVNATVLFSEIAAELAKGEPFGACYFDRFDGKRQWSLRSDAHGMDVSAVAKAYGGGGHRNAAGYEEDAEPQKKLVLAQAERIAAIVEEVRRRRFV